MCLFDFEYIIITRKNCGIFCELVELIYALHFNFECLCTHVLWEFKAFVLCKLRMFTLHLHIDTLAWYVIEMMDCLLTKPVCTGSFKHFYHWQGVMTDLWLISVPLDKTSITSVEKLRQTIDKTNLASCFMFSIPDLKVSFSCRVKLR